MRLKMLFLAAALPVSLSACGRADEGNVATDMNNIGAEEVGLDNQGAPAAASSAQEFANKAAASDRFEIESSKLAAASASSAAVKEFAEKMIAGHTDSSAKLKSTLAADPSGITIDDALSPEQQSTIDGLKTKKGAEFDTAYAAAQVGAHEKTLATLNDYAAAGDNAALKTFAQELVPVVTEHLNSARTLK